ncbi:MAG: hypothetical protein E6G53_00070 [Actinobacteria bacterium]|nr:MAG: hypothetical protein E6G53_00070 [Actinomycetota bacterium]
MRRLIACGLVAVVAAIAAPAAFGSNYIVLYKQQSVKSDAAATIQKAGGTLVYSYPAIGVVIASSTNPSFRDNLLKDSSVENAASTAGFATRLPDTEARAGSSSDSGPPPGDLPSTPASDSDSLSPLQWDMRQIHTPEAHAITGGSPAVLVGDIDTGIDFNHPDLRQNIDVANSANCVSGAPVPGTAAQDDNGHGTHTAGTIAATSRRSRRATRRGSSSPRRSSVRSCGPRTTASTSPTTATSPIRTSSTAGTTRFSGRSGRRSSGRSSTPSRTA